MLVIINSGIEARKFYDSSFLVSQFCHKNEHRFSIIKKRRSFVPRIITMNNNKLHHHHLHTVAQTRWK
jgi:hypothetical protein